MDNRHIIGNNLPQCKPNASAHVHKVTYFPCNYIIRTLHSRTRACFLATLASRMNEKTKMQECPLDRVFIEKYGELAK